uniref:Hes family bHLH transcription factor 2 n=1 Tax=Nothobranchius furzeri TaxID=105023 RepID=A0A8C6PZZ8_NOTFU
MSPSITAEASLSTPSRSTVAQRKQANELRKTLKPLLEKRRRARINDSLSHLKSLILPLIGKDNARYSKLEKADILEMTVRFLRDLPSSPVKGEPRLQQDHRLNKYKYLSTLTLKYKLSSCIFYSSRQTLQTVTERATKLAYSASPRCSPKPAWTRTRASASTSSCSSPCPPPSHQPA